MKLLPTIAVLAAIIALPAVAAAAEMHMNVAGADSESAKAFSAANQAMMKDMALTPTGDADRDFVTMMIPHHQGAIAMAKIELQFGKDPEIRKLAEDIVTAQEKEIVGMQTWLAAHPL